MDETIPDYNPFRALADYDVSHDFYDSLHKRMGKFREFTPLQKTAFADEAFWDARKSLMIQGATSSGKTMVAEVAMHQCRKYGNCPRVIYLAPLRLMVSEKYKQFSEVFGDQVYASSRDYQVYDEEITNGYYSVAVIVYEKFYALLSQNDPSRLLGQCGLIVLDEAQMMGEPDRGMKIMMSLILANQVNPNIRIIGLSTTYSDMSQILDWFQNSLGKSLERIFNPLNSLPLEEMVLDYSGKFRGKYVPSADDKARPDCERYEEEQAERLQTHVLEPDALRLLDGIDPAPAVRPPVGEMKKELLLRLARVERGRKIIIFCNSRQYCRTLAEAIAREIAEGQKLDRDIKRRLELERSDNAKLMLETLFPKGVAFHHAALSHSLRSIIEDGFRGSQLNVLVATETLAIGVNLPADTIIVFDTQKRIDQRKEDIAGQAYKNYIGRAGRLLERENLFCPQSFLLSLDRDEFRRYWQSYVNASVTTIEPVFKRLRSKDAIPFFLSILSLSDVRDRDFRPTAAGIRLLLKRQLPGVRGVEEFSTLMEDRLTEEEKEISTLYEDWISAGMVIAMDNKYHLTRFGKKIVPYAISLEASAIIHQYFYAETTPGCLPVKATVSDIDGDVYLPDILFLVCGTPEVRKVYAHGELRMDSSVAHAARFFQLRRELLAHLRDLVSKHKTWPGSRLQRLLEDPEEIDDEILLADLFNVALLYYWIRGGTLDKFRKGTGISYTPEEGTVERLGNIASYMIEVIGNALKATEARFKLATGFARLSSRASYGCDDDCVHILNCHLPEISRQSILEAEEAAKNAPGCPTLLHYLMHADISDRFSEYQITKLREALRRKYYENKQRLLNSLILDGKIPYQLIDQFNGHEHAEDWSEDCETFFRTIAEDETAPFLFRADDGQDDVYIATYLSFQLRVILLRGGNQMYNLSNFNSSFGAYLQHHPGKYLVVVNQENMVNWQKLIDTYSPYGCRVSWASYEDLKEQYLYALTMLGRNSFHPFLYALYASGDVQFRPQPNLAIPAEGCWAPEEAPEVFISYVHRGSSDFAAELYERLARTGRRVFLDAVGIRVGDDFPQVLREAIHSSRAYVLLFDDDYGTARSPWTVHEIDAIQVELRNNPNANKKIIALARTPGGERTREGYHDLNHYLYSGCENAPRHIEEAARAIEQYFIS